MDSFKDWYKIIGGSEIDLICRCPILTMLRECSQLSRGMTRMLSCNDLVVINDLSTSKEIQVRQVRQIVFIGQSRKIKKRASLR